MVRFTGEAVGNREPAAVRGRLRWSGRVVGVSAVVGGGAMVAAALLGATPPDPRRGLLLARDAPDPSGRRDLLHRLRNRDGAERDPEAAARALAPAFATLYGEGDEARIRRGYARSTRLLVLSALPLAGMTTAVGPAAIDVVYGRAGALLVIRAATLPVLALDSVSRSLIGALGHQRILLVTSIAAAAFDLTLDFVLIPRLGRAVRRVGAPA